MKRWQIPQYLWARIMVNSCSSRVQLREIFIVSRAFSMGVSSEMQISEITKGGQLWCLPRDTVTMKLFKLSFSLGRWRRCFQYRSYCKCTFVVNNDKHRKCYTQLSLAKTIYYLKSQTVYITVSAALHYAALQYPAICISYKFRPFFLSRYLSLIRKWNNCESSQNKSKWKQE